MRRSDYTADAVAACKSVLVELVHLLGEIKDHLVVVGGWVPVLLFPDAAASYPGTLDVDLALDVAKIPEETYRTILRSFKARSYEPARDQPFIFLRTVARPGAAPITVQVDLLAAEYGGTGPSHRTRPVQDVRARKARGCDLAFTDPIDILIEAELPGGGLDRVVVRVARIVPWLVMKGMALHDRIKEKDAFDIYFAVRHYEGGIAALADAIRPHLHEALVVEGLRKIRSKFVELDSVGPKHVTDFLELTDREERGIRTRDAFETVTRLLDHLEISPWDQR